MKLLFPSISLSKIIVAIALAWCLFFFSFVIVSNWSALFCHVLYDDSDESSNSAVSANVYRQFWPPTIRINSLFGGYTGWREGPYWQHIPPLFTYAPLPLFWLDGGVTIEVKRLAYAGVVLVTGLLFVCLNYFFSPKYRVLLMSVLAVMWWWTVYFTWSLVVSENFGTSDLVLAFSCVLAYGGLLFYFKKKYIENKRLSTTCIIVLSILSTLPIIVKSFLGALSLFFLVVLILFSKTSNKIRQLLIVALIALALIALHWGLLYYSSPITFWAENGTALKHLGDYETWARPWSEFFINYLPNLYFKETWRLFVVAIGFYLVGMIYFWRTWREEKRRWFLLFLPGVWGALNLIVCSAITSKAPNFIFQSLLFCLWAICYALVEIILTVAGKYGWVHEYVKKLNSYVEHNVRYIKFVLIIVLAVSLLAVFEVYSVLWRKFTIDHNYQSFQNKDLVPGEDFYSLAFVLKNQGVGVGDIVIFNLKDNLRDFSARYDVLFLTGAESRGLGELLDRNIESTALKAQYRNIYLVNESPDALKLSLPWQKIGPFNILSLKKQDSPIIQNSDGLVSFVKDETTKTRSIVDLYENSRKYQFLRVTDPGLYQKFSDVWQDRALALLPDLTTLQSLTSTVQFSQMECVRQTREKVKLYVFLKTADNVRSMYDFYIHAGVRDKIYLPIYRLGYSFDVWDVKVDDAAPSWYPAGWYVVEKEATAYSTEYYLNFGLLDKHATKLGAKGDWGWVDFKTFCR